VTWKMIYVYNHLEMIRPPRELTKTILLKLDQEQKYGKSSKDIFLLEIIFILKSPAEKTWEH